MKHTFSFSHILDSEVELQVYATFSKGRMASRQNFDRFAEPDEPDEIEINRVLDCNGLDIITGISDEQFEEIESAAFEHYDSCDADYCEY